MEIVETTQPVELRLREEFLAPYRRKGDPFKSLLARSTYLTKYCRGNVETWTDTIRRVVEGNVSLAPGVTEMEAELLFHLFWTGQALPPGRGLWTGGVPGIPADARYNCFSKETRFWANGRLTSFEEAVDLPTEVLCLDGRWRPATVKSFGKQKLQTVCMKPPGRTNFKFNFTVTANHRWITNNRGEVTDLRVGDRVLVKPRDLSELRSKQDYKDGFAHGFLFGDGCKETLKETTYRLRFCGEKDQRHKDLLMQARYFHLESTYIFDNGDPLLYFKSEVNLRRTLPSDQSTQEYQAGFIEGWLAADGSWRTSGRGGNRLCSINGDAIEWAVERLPLLGYCPTGQYTDSNMETNFGERSAPIQVLTVRPEPIEYTVRSIMDTGREEDVYCVVEPETHTFTLEGGVPTGNCWYSTLHSPEDWCWTANQLMLGGGVGVGLGHIDSLPRVRANDARFAIWCRGDHADASEVQAEGPEFLNGTTPVYRAADSREGWVEALRRVLASAYSGENLVIDVSDIRSRGSIIRTFGGIACGPGPLAHLLRSTWKLVRGAAGRTLTSVECLDITNHIGLCIKSGNVRRSALIVLGTSQDQDFRDAKKDWDAVLSHRHTSNNSIMFRSAAEIEAFNWESLVEDNIHFGEPGILNLAKVWETDPGAKGVNPCFSGDALIAVADGRNAVTIKQLAEEGRDVPVYSMSKETGMVEIKIGRHPRVTGTSKKLVRVWLDDGSHLDTTPDHTFLLLDGTKVEARFLTKGVSLPRFTKALEPVTTGGKDYYRIYCNTRDPSQDKIYEHRLIARFHNPEEWDRVYSECSNNGFISGGLVVHHKDYDPLNNAPDNLELMSFRDHARYHGLRDNSGEHNGRWSKVTGEMIKEKALGLTRQLGRRFSNDDWEKFAADQGLPQQFSEFRVQTCGSVLELAKWCASELGYEHSDEDPRVVKTYQSMLEQGYSSRIDSGRVLVCKRCETCHASFEVPHAYRERAFCSMACGNRYINYDEDIRAKRRSSLETLYGTRMQKVRSEQARVCSSLAFRLGRRPTRKEWSLACKEENLTSRIGPTLTHGFKHFEEVLQAGAVYNHKVVRVEELPGEHTVYNITVDDNHTVAVVTSTREKRGHCGYSGIFVTQCGEQALHDKEACNLAEVFPAQFESETNPWVAFRLVTRYCLRQRLTPLMDPVSHEIGQRNMRVGVGLGGICDFDWTPEQLAEWFGVVRKEADDYAEELGVNKPITVSTVKPSGTTSLLNGSSPGIHAPHSPFYIRRTRIAKNDPMAQAMIDAGVPYEEDSYDKKGHTWVFSFPTKAPHTRITKQTETIREQFERQATIQKWWADNAVSATLNFNPETEKEVLANCLREYVPQLKSTSCLASAHAYVQAPYEAIDEGTYHRMMETINNDHPLVNGGEIEIEECSNGSCPIR